MSIFKSIGKWIANIRKLKRCDNVGEFARYCTSTLKTPQLIAWWISQSIWYENEKNPQWHSADSALNRKKGNCTEMAVLGVMGLRAIGIESCCLCIYGEKEGGEKKAHAVASFQYKDGTIGYIEGGSVITHKNMPWQTLVQFIRSDWQKVDNYRWCDFNGNTEKGFGL